MGQYFDEETQLHYNRHRYFSPETGQYISPDPIGLQGGTNPYGYVHNPLSWVDPLGLAGAKGNKGDFVTEQIFDPKQLQKKFKHAIDFGVTGNANKQGIAAFEKAMKDHIDSPATTKITGKYRWKQDAHHYYDKDTNLDVMTDLNGNFISGWKLSEKQAADLLEAGNVF
jgi:RHS repeat-associated protein